MELVKIIPVANTLGEGVVWDDQNDCLWWTDIEEKILHRYDWHTQALEKIALPLRLASFALTNKPNWIIAAFASGIAFFNFRSRALRWIYQIDDKKSGLRFNDGRVDRLGRFWTGTMVEDASKGNVGSLYCLNETGQLKLHYHGLQITNSLAWSVDGQAMYLADSAQHEIKKIMFNNDQGQFGESTIFHKTAADVFPDGSCIDSQNRLWNAQWGGSKIRCIDEHGDTQEILELPSPQLSCVCFAGPKLDHVAVTSARVDQENLQNYPNAGNVFIVKAFCQGLKESRYIISEQLQQKFNLNTAAIDDQEYLPSQGAI